MSVPQNKITTTSQNRASVNVTTGTNPTSRMMTVRPTPSCRKGKDCRKYGCWHDHPSDRNPDCRFGKDCWNDQCLKNHPEINPESMLDGTILPDQDYGSKHPSDAELDTEPELNTEPELDSEIVLEPSPSICLTDQRLGKIADEWEEGARARANTGYNIFGNILLTDQRYNEMADEWETGGLVFCPY